MIRLNELEEQIMDVLWKEKKAFPKVIMAYLKEPVPPYNTVLSAIRKLEKMGLVNYRIFGKSHEYFPILTKDQYGSTLYKKLRMDLIEGGKMSMLSYFVKEEKISIKELEKLVEELKSKKDD